MKKTKINPYEILYIKVESVNTNNSVIGSISTRGKRVNGSTYTLHNSIVGADNKLYKYSQKNGSYPFKVDDIMILMCSKDDTDGMYNINSFVNLTNGTRKIESKFGSVIIACIVSIIFIFSALGGKITIGYLFFLLIWIALWTYFPLFVYKSSYKTHKSVIDILLSTQEVKTDLEVRNCLVKHNGQIVIANNIS